MTTDDVLKQKLRDIRPFFSFRYFESPKRKVTDITCLKESADQSSRNVLTVLGPRSAAHYRNPARVI